jgi:hypothetical protein
MQKTSTQTPVKTFIKTSVKTFVKTPVKILIKPSATNYKNFLNYFIKKGNTAKVETIFKKGLLF